ncbi:MAG TPA: TSUP family transporter [Steroidobacteraceae bacterium]|nr:TSUP family transporter [Steroidobacteraceae bacterium]
MFPAPETLVVLLAAFAAGLVDAIVGGGGLIQAPALFSFYPAVQPATLLGTSKFAGVFGTASAAVRYSRRVGLPWALLGPLALLVMLTAALGAVVATRVPAQVFRPIVPALLVVVTAYLLRHREIGVTHAPRVLAGGARALAVALIAAIGFYDGFFGPGTGSFLMIVFVRLYGFDFLHAAGSARVLNVATNLAALGWFAAHDAVIWELGLAMAACNIAGAMAGTRLAFRGGNRFVRRAFIAIVVGLILRTSWTAFVR